MTWLASQNKLDVKARLARWNLALDSSCCLCQREVEPVNHLFFECPFSSSIWKIMLQKCGSLRNIVGWRREVGWWTKKTMGKNMLASIRRIVFNATIYYIWVERNKWIFQQVTPEEIRVVRLVGACIRMKLMQDSRMHTVGWSCWL